MFSKETYVNRRKELMTQMSDGIVLFPGNSESPMNYTDNTYPFRQDSTFLYYFGLKIPQLFAVIDIDEGVEILFGDDLTIDMIVWMGNQPELKEHAQTVGVEQVRPLKDLEKYIKVAQLNNRKIHFLNPYRHDIVLQLSGLLNVNTEQLGAMTSLDFIQTVVRMRQVKSNEEITEIEKAVNTSVDMHITAMKMAKPGIKEWEIAAEVQKVAIAAGGDISFPVIATINGQTLHNHYHGNTLQKGDLFLLDAGAQTEMGYCGDISSTFPVARSFSEEQKLIYQISLNAHEKAISMLRPEIAFKDIHLEVCRTIIEDMKGIGLMKGNTEDALELGAHAMFFPCGLGHMMGLDVHDMENLGEKWVGYNGVEKSTQFGLKSLRLGKELKPGFVLTIEPGIYFIPELIYLWEGQEKFKDYLNYNEIKKFKSFGGIRNEEDFLITEDGARVLGKSCPKTIEQVEEIRSN